MLQQPITPSSHSPLSLHDVKKAPIRLPSTSSIVKKPLPTPRSSVAATPRLPSSKEKQPVNKLTIPTHIPTDPSTIFTLTPLSLPDSLSQQQAATTDERPLTSPNTTPPTNHISPPMSPTLQQMHSPSSMSLYSMGSEQLLDHSHLKPGGNASLLSYATTINMYRTNAKKTNDVEIQCDFAIFLVEAAKRLLGDVDENNNNTNSTTTTGSEDNSNSCEESSNNDDDDQQGGNRHSASAYLTEAEKLLKQVASHGHSPSQYYLANMYSSGLLHKSSKCEYDKAFPLYVQSAKHHHPDAAYRTAKCYEDGLGTRRDKAKAVQFYRKAATLNHPGAMYRLGLAEMKGDLGMSINIRDGHKWLKRSAEASTTEYPHALHELAHLHERGVASIIFQDHDYAIRLYQDASDLGYAPSCFRLGECYEFGRLGCAVDPRQSMHYYGLAAEQGHPHACFALTAWYLIGVPGVMPPCDEQAFAWAMRAAHQGLARAEYAVGYFYEVGIGIEKNQSLAWEYYQKAAGHGEKRAMQRIQQAGGAYTLDPPTPCASESSLSTSSQQRRQSSTGSVSSDGWVKKWKRKLSWTRSSSTHL
ncbi:hypothetical protein BC941DRAFT_431008 [Chlamydoabsidia padenii]|nr:hypothetical protein BC941DRAFT_431008 [Chlamydoabsidia padenii]